MKELLLIGLFIANMSAFAQPLDSLLQRVVDNNPELKSVQLNYEAELARRNQVRDLPTTNLGVGVPVLPAETRLGAQVFMVSASQMFPWFGTRGAKEDVVIAMSEAKFERITALRLMLYNKVELAYYNLVDLDNKRQIIQQLLDQFTAIEKWALVKQGSGGGSLVNVLRVQLKMEELQRKLAAIELMEQKNYAIINSLIAAPIEAKIEVVTPKVELMDLNFAEQEQKISESHPMINMINAQMRASENRQLVNRKMAAPRIGAGIDYAVVSERTDMNPEFNGRDIFVPKVMISVPLYRKGFKARDKEEQLVQTSLALNKEAIVLEIMAQLRGYQSDYAIAVSDIEFYLKEVNKTNQILELLMADYSASGKQFDELLQVQNELLNYEIQMSEAQKRKHQAQSNMNKLINF